MSTKMNDSLEDVLAEVERATAHFPTWPADPFQALAILGEEFGELTKAVLQTTYEPHKVGPGELRTEAIQTAAMALRFLAHLDGYHFGRSGQISLGIDRDNRGLREAADVAVTTGEVVFEMMRAESVANAFESMHARGHSHINAIEAARIIRDSCAVAPDGYALVPVEPTTAMKCRAVEAWEGPAAYKSIFARGLADLEDEAAECWAAMLAAANKENGND